MSEALIGAGIFLAAGICAFATLGANTYASVRRNDHSMLCAFISTSVLCAIHINAFATLRANALALVLGWEIKKITRRESRDADHQNYKY
jgi:hypothetical protein